MKDALLYTINPRPVLQGFALKYHVYRFVFEKNSILPPKFHAPRPEHCITFYVKDPQKFSYWGTDEIITYPKCVINGIYNIPLNRYGGHDFLAIKCVLQPTALYHLLKTPVNSLTNTFLNAEDVWGKRIAAISDQLNSCDSLQKMISIIESFFEDLLKTTKKSIHPIDAVCSYMLQQDLPASQERLAGQSCLSVRHFIRKFEDRIGISPKMFSRIIRFDKAYRLKNSHPHLDWLYIALATGHYDYQHLVKEYRTFTSLSPAAFYDKEKKSPERSFGLHES